MKTCPSFSNYCLTFCGRFLNVSSNIDCNIFNKSWSVYGSKISWFFCSISSPLFLMSSLKSSMEFAIPTILMLFLFKLWTNAPNFLVSPSVIVKESISSITSNIWRGCYKKSGSSPERILKTGQRKPRSAWLNSCRLNKGFDITTKPPPNIMAY